MDFTPASVVCTGLTVANGASLTGDVVLNGGTFTATGDFEGTITAGTASVDYDGKGLIAAYTAKNGLVLSGSLDKDDVLSMSKGTVTAGFTANAMTGAIVIEEGATVYGQATTLGNVDVYGQLKVAKTKTLTVTTLNLYGSAELVGETGHGTITVTTLNAGASQTKYFEDSAVTIDVTAMSIDGQAYVASTADVSTGAIALNTKTVFCVGTEAFMTAYDQSGASVAITSITAIPVTDADTSDKWYDASTDEILSGDTKKIGDPTKVYANVDYDVYDVIIRAQSGISDVLLDGGFMDKDGQTFTLTGIAAGDYEVTALDADGNAVDVVLTVGKTEVSDNILSVTGGSPTTDKHVTISAQLTLAEETEKYVVAFDDKEITVEVDGEEIDSFNSVAAGTKLTITAVEKTGYTAQLYVNGDKNSGTYTVADSGVLITVEYTAVETEEYVVAFDDKEITVEVDGKEIDSFDSVAVGKKLTITAVEKTGYTAQLYVNGDKNDGSYTIADSGVLITVEYTADGDEPVPSKDVVVGIKTTEDGNVKVILAADDEGTISAGTVTVTMSYAMVDEYGVWDIDTFEITVEVEYTGSGYQIVDVDLITDNEYYEYATGLVASFEDENGEYVSEKIQFTPAIEA